jgi:hypothetical protein
LLLHAGPVWPAKADTARAVAPIAFDVVPRYACGSRSARYLSVMQQILPAPRTPRELIELFAVYQGQNGISSVLNAVDFGSLDRTGVLKAVLGDVPQRRLEQEVPEGYNPRGHVRTLLHSREFRDRARKLILEAFPEKRRAILIHIPKCAGTDLTDTLRRRYPALLQGHFAFDHHAAEAFFHDLRAFAIGVRYADTIALAGHERLAFYQQQRLVRPADWVFTVVRDPTSLMYSYISYVLTICRSAPVTRRPDGLGWLGLLGISEIPEDASDADMADLGRQVMYNTAIPPKNPICHSLGDGSAITAMERIATSNVEITDTTRYAAWRRARFPWAEETRANASTPYFSAEMATARDRDYIASLTEEDRKLFELIRVRLDLAGGLSIRGREMG